MHEKKEQPGLGVSQRISDPKTLVPDLQYMMKIRLENGKPVLIPSVFEELKPHGISLNPQNQTSTDVRATKIGAILGNAAVQVIGQLILCCHKYTSGVYALGKEYETVRNHFPPTILIITTSGPWLIAGDVCSATMLGLDLPVPDLQALTDQVEDAATEADSHIGPVEEAQSSASTFSAFGPGQERLLLEDFPLAWEPLQFPEARRVIPMKAEETINSELAKSPSAAHQAAVTGIDWHPASYQIGEQATDTFFAGVQDHVGAMLKRSSLWTKVTLFYGSATRCIADTE